MVFGGFLEHPSRAVYQGVYDPDCVHADEDGFHADVMGALNRLEMTTMRYPRGNFVSGYHPVRRDRRADSIRGSDTRITKPSLIAGYTGTTGRETRSISTS